MAITFLRRAVDLYLLMTCAVACLLACMATSVIMPSALSAQPPPLEPATTGGIPAIDRALAKLSSHRRLLMIGAHPDDEDTLLLSYVARGQGGEATYLSLSRGDGGQNLIGPENGVGLGLLRSRELEAARAIDGAHQRFTRAYDFGFTRSLDETFERWPKAVLLEDAMRVVRRFKPQVLVAVFPPSAAAGHGQHWASGVVASDIFELSRQVLGGGEDPFPELTAAGLDPWPIDSFFRAAWFMPGDEGLHLPLDAIEPFSGRSVFQIALASRSQHRCQDMGFLQPPGYASDRLLPVAGAFVDQPAGDRSRDLFDGVDTSLSAIADALDDGALRQRVAGDLDRVEKLATTARRRLSPLEPASAVEPLAEIVSLLRATLETLATGGRASTGVDHVHQLVSEKLAVASEGLAAAASIMADAVTDRELVVAGDTLAVRSMLWAAGAQSVDDLAVEIVAADGWQPISSAADDADEGRFSTELTDGRRFDVAVSESQPATVPYFLTRAKTAGLYDWTAVDASTRGQPFGTPPVSVRFRFTLAGAEVEIEREAVYRYRDQARGEVRRPLRVVPALEVALDQDLIVWPMGRERAAIGVGIRSHVDQPVAGRLEVDAPPGWQPIEAQQFSISEPHGQARLMLQLEPTTALVAGRSVQLAMAAIVDTEGGVEERFEQAIEVIDYEHIRPVTRPVPAQLEISTVALALPSAVERIGYLRGASDQIPELLAEVGLPIEVLDGAALETLTLSDFDVIVVGPRAYEVDPVLALANGRLLAYVEAGGLLLVQYQQYQWAAGHYTPQPIDISRPHDRVTDETAPVELLVPDHPVFHRPNPLTDADWQGWVQERGLYFAGTWHDAYQPLLAMADDGPPQTTGALLVADVGDGRYIYTGLAFHRQLPAGVAGAYRLFVNLLAQGR